ncbi:hypothetical protein HanIR_Chr05g0245201 [Helianthus annuus]|nr:hypothetical protein HanIR_Chr05g0245201 [Helianthus annuus]
MNIIFRRFGSFLSLTNRGFTTRPRTHFLIHFRTTTTTRFVFQTRHLHSFPIQLILQIP